MKLNDLVYDIIKISIIEDSEIHREWLVMELAEESKLSVVSADRFGRQGIESVKSMQSNLVILDFQLEDMTGLEVAKRLKNFNKNIKIFIITAHSEISIIERLINDKYIDAIAIKGSHFFNENLIYAIHYVAKGGHYLDPSLLNKLRDLKNSDVSSLTKREFEIFVQMNIGKPDKKIANDLCVELAYVKNVKSKIKKKIDNKEIKNLAIEFFENIYKANEDLV